MDKYLEQTLCDFIRNVYQSIHTSKLSQFTFALIDSLWNDSDAVLFELTHGPSATCKELSQVIEGLTEARNELRLARFLFEVEEIQPLYRLIMRNKAVSRAEGILQRVLRAWPVSTADKSP